MPSPRDMSSLARRISMHANRWGLNGLPSVFHPPSRLLIQDGLDPSPQERDQGYWTIVHYFYRVAICQNLAAIQESLSG